MMKIIDGLGEEFGTQESNGTMKDIDVGFWMEVIERDSQTDGIFGMNQEMLIQISGCFIQSLDHECKQLLPLFQRLINR